MRGEGAKRAGGDKKRRGKVAAKKTVKREGRGKGAKRAGGDKKRRGKVAAKKDGGKGGARKRGKARWRRHKKKKIDSR